MNTLIKSLYQKNDVTKYWYGFGGECWSINIENRRKVCIFKDKPNEKNPYIFENWTHSIKDGFLIVEDSGTIYRYNIVGKRY